MPMVTQILDLVNRIQQVEEQWVARWEIIRCSQALWEWTVWACKICNSQEWWCRTKWASHHKVSTWTLTCKWCSILKTVARTHKTLNSNTVWCPTNSCTCKKWWECRCKPNKWVAFQLSSTSKTLRRPKMEHLNRWTDQWLSVQWNNLLMCRAELKKHAPFSTVVRMSKHSVN